MRAQPWGRARTTISTLLAGLLVASGLVAVGVGAVAAPASADTAPSTATVPATVAADALPTVQINGVAWSQAVVGNKVWVAGGFTRARPAGAAPGVSEVDRRNVLVYDIRTGQRDTSFVENLNATGQVVAVSPDGRRVYVGGDFTSAGGQRHERIVAFDAATGRVVHSFAAHVDQRVAAIAATNDTVYVGGSFLTANGTSRTRLAAFRASDGALLNWAPTAQDQPVQSMVMAPDNRTLYVGGKFLGLNGNGVRGLGALDTVTGATKPLPVASLISNGGTGGSITSLSVDGDNLYGTGFVFGAQYGTLEGVFAARLSDGNLSWVADCHGDHYSSAVVDGVVYAAGHAHYCGNVDSFGQTEPWRFDRALAFSKQATGTAMRNAVGGSGYFNFDGRPRPDVLHWYPMLNAGTYTGQGQGPWSVAGNRDYVVYGGEFTRAMNLSQQGLVRFARRGVAPDAIGPQSGSSLTPVLDTLTPGTVRVAWQTSWDYDNEALTYRVVRNGQVGSPVHTVTVDSAQFDRPYLSWTDTSVTPGTSYSYRIYVTDALGNENRGSTVRFTPGGGKDLSPYAQRVVADGAEHLWRFSEPSGRVKDWAGGDDLVPAAGLTRPEPGAIGGDPDPAGRFSGTSTGTTASSGAVMAPQQFTVEAWVRTSATSGGKIIGFSNRQSGTSNVYDRHLYVDSGGRITFGTNPGQVRTLRSPAAYNDGAWHHVVGTLGPNGQTLYVDGARVAQNSAWTVAVPVTGHWRVGGDNLGGWPNRPASDYLSGLIDEAAVYHSALTEQQVAAHHSLGRGQTPPNAAPTAQFSSQVSNLTATLDGRASTDVDGTLTSWAWSFGDGTTGTGPTASRTYAAPGTYTVTLVVTDDKGATGQRQSQVTVTAPPVNQAPTARFQVAGADLRIDVDGSSSSDPDGTVASWRWEFGDGGTATGRTATRTYAAAGSYDVRLTVTDDKGATASTTTRVTVQAPPAVEVYAEDTFARTVTNGWALADTGGAWALAGGSASDYAVTGVKGTTRIAGPAQSRSVYLNGVQQDASDTYVTVSTDKAQTGGGSFVAVIGRRVPGAGDYRTKLRLLNDGSVQAVLVRVQGSETALAAMMVPGLVNGPGTDIRVRTQVTGTSPTTIRTKVWAAGTPEPTEWMLTATDGTAALQQPGSVGMSAYLSGSATNAPMTIGYDDLWVGTPGGLG